VVEEDPIPFKHGVDVGRTTKYVFIDDGLGLGTGTGTATSDVATAPFSWTGNPSVGVTPGDVFIDFTAQMATLEYDATIVYEDFEDTINGVFKNRAREQVSVTDFIENVFIILLGEAAIGVSPDEVAILEAGFTVRFDQTNSLGPVTSSLVSGLFDGNVYQPVPQGVFEIEANDVIALQVPSIDSLLLSSGAKVDSLTFNETNVKAPAVGSGFAFNKGPGESFSWTVDGPNALLQITFSTGMDIVDYFKVASPPGKTTGDLVIAAHETFSAGTGVSSSLRFKKTVPPSAIPVWGASLADFAGTYVSPGRKVLVDRSIFAADTYYHVLPNGTGYVEQPYDESLEQRLFSPMPQAFCVYSDGVNLDQMLWQFVANPGDCGSPVTGGSDFGYLPVNDLVGYKLELDLFEEFGGVYKSAVKRSYNFDCFIDLSLVCSASIFYPDDYYQTIFNKLPIVGTPLRIPPTALNVSNGDVMEVTPFGIVVEGDSVAIYSGVEIVVPPSYGVTFIGDGVLTWDDDGDGGATPEILTTVGSIYYSPEPSALGTGILDSITYRIYDTNGNVSLGFIELFLGAF
jgi:hypothetical protein